MSACGQLVLLRVRVSRNRVGVVVLQSNLALLDSARLDEIAVSFDSSALGSIFRKLAQLLEMRLT